MNAIHPIPRQSRPDAETSERIILIKNVGELRSTYQVRLLALKAAQTGKKLILMVPPECQFRPALAILIAATGGLILREDL